MMRGIALQVLGSAVAGRDSLLEALEQPEGEVPFFQARILIGLCYLNWAEGALQDQKKSAKNLLELGQSHNDAHAVVHACWFSGAAHYHLNNLDAAANVVHLVAQDRWWPHHRSYLNCVQIMSLTHVARGEYSRALDLSKSLVDQCLESRSTFHLPDVYALQAGIAHARGDHETALRWALDFEPGPVTAAWGLLVPALIAARILLHSTQADAREKAKEILDEHHSYFETTNTKQFLTETLALKAMLCAKYGDGEGADQFLSRAIDLAEHGGFIRIFVDLGPGIVPLLNRLELSEQQLKYVGTILAGFAGDSGNGSSGVVVESNRHDGAGALEPLTKRENDVLELLAQRLTNKEIGERLFISPDTVKRHAHNVFAKLNVSTRREARAKAIGLGIVSD
jgi:LuxR family maltose regulon positive regulatory protein